MRKPFFYIVGILFLLGCSGSSIAAVHPYAWPESTWSTLNVGIYWVAKKNVYCRADNKRQMGSPQCRDSYRPNRPTLLFIHGWEPGSVRMHSRFSFFYAAPGVPEKDWYLAKFWQAKGWNVGVFYWNQLSDTTLPSQAEAKIWSTREHRDMYWKQDHPDLRWWAYDRVTYRNACEHPNSVYCQPVKQILYDDYVKALRHYHGSKIFVVGHSVGAELAIAFVHDLAERVARHELAPRYLPSRLVLLDPYYSEYLDEARRRNQGSLVADLSDRDGIVVTEYLSSDVTLPDEWGPLERTAALTYYRPWFDWSWNEAEKHYAAWVIYLQTIKSKPPKLYIERHQRLQVMPLSGPAASESNLTLAAMMGDRFYWDQDCGRHGMCGEYTAGTDNDAFLTLPIDLKLPAPKKIAFHHFDPKHALKLRSGKIYRIETSVLPDDASNRLLLWKSQNPSIVRIYPGGYVQALKPGTATVTAIVPWLNDQAQLKTIKRKISIKVVSAL